MHIKDLKMWHFILIAVITPVFTIGATYGVVTSKLDQVNETRKELDSTKDRVYNLEKELAKTSISSQKDIGYLKGFKEEITNRFDKLEKKVEDGMEETRDAIKDLTEIIIKNQNQNPYLIGYGE